MNTRIFTLNNYLRQKFKQRVQKIPLDAKFSCPNRDGTISTQGCIFCNPKGSGTNLAKQGFTLTQQYLLFQEKFQHKYKAKLFLAYLQSYSNTYGPLEKLANVLKEIKNLPQLAGIALGTRPDCLDKEKCDLINSFNFKEIWLEIGLQSAKDKTLRLINRGHTYQCFVNAISLLSSYNFKICVHVIAGLPEENKQDFLHTIHCLNQLPIHGIKFHNIYVCKQTTLAKWWEQGNFTPLGLQEYLEWLGEAIAILRKDIIIHRLNGDPAPNELLAPLWAKNKSFILQQINTYLTEKNIVQGQNSSIC
ncbi:MAG: TIGR01212 family radical SAM protein [Desulfonauticus sp.]|nr:TIGR01212 family radical SAM protein [Desulfonauticus sp.]